METLSIVSDFDVPRNVPPGVFPGGVDGAVNELVLQRGEERLGHGVIEADPGAADRLAQVERGEDAGELRRCVVAAPVGVEDRTRFERMIRVRLFWRDLMRPAVWRC